MKESGWAKPPKRERHASRPGHLDLSTVILSITGPAVAVVLCLVTGAVTASQVAPLILSILGAVFALMLAGAPSAYVALNWLRARVDLPVRPYWAGLPAAPLDIPFWPRLATSVAAVFPFAVWSSVAMGNPNPIVAAWLGTATLLLIAPTMLFVAGLASNRIERVQRDQRRALAARHLESIPPVVPPARDSS